MQTLYDVLGVPVSATLADIDKAHRRLLVRVHPDRCYNDNDSTVFNPAEELDEARLNVLEKAHTILADPEKRRLYDLYLAQRQRSIAVPPLPFASPLEWFTGRTSDAESSEDVLRSMLDLLSSSLSPPKPFVSATAGSPPSQEHQGRSEGKERPLVYTTAVHVQRRPDGTVQVQRYSGGQLPRRLQVMEEHLVARNKPPTTAGGDGSDETTDAADAATNATITLIATTTAEA